MPLSCDGAERSNRSRLPGTWLNLVAVLVLALFTDYPQKHLGVFCSMMRDPLEMAIEPFRFEAAAKGLDLTLQISSDVLDSLVDDPWRLRQALVNPVSASPTAALGSRNKRKPFSTRSRKPTGR